MGRKNAMMLYVDNLPDTGVVLFSEDDPEAYPVLEEMREAGECRFLAPIRAELRARPVRDMIEVKGVVETTIGLDCRRCLAEYALPAQREFTLYYVSDLPEIETDGSEEGTELTAEELGLMTYEGDRIDLSEAVSEQMVMAIPGWPLCADECKGLCAHCGADLNVAACGCEDKPLDDRFAVLKKLKLPK